MKNLRDEEQSIEEGVVMKEECIYIPKGELKREVVCLHHDMLVGEHGGRQKIVELVTRNYWWPGVIRKVGRYVDRYDIYQQYKNKSETLAKKLMPNAIPEKPWSHILADFITKLPLAQGYDAILVVCDRFSKMAYFIATTEKISAEGLTRLFRDHIQKLHGLLESIISDRGVQFIAEIIKELNKLLGIWTKLLMAYYPQTDGQTERVNQELEQYLRVFINYRQDNGQTSWGQLNLHIITRYIQLQKCYYSRLIMVKIQGWDLRGEGRGSTKWWESLQKEYRKFRRK